jgi:hypothetical protein
MVPNTGHKQRFCQRAYRSANSCQQIIFYIEFITYNKCIHTKLIVTALIKLLTSNLKKIRSTSPIDCILTALWSDYPEQYYHCTPNSVSPHWQLEAGDRQEAFDVKGPDALAGEAGTLFTACNSRVANDAAYVPRACGQIVTAV